MSAQTLETLATIGRRIAECSDQPLNLNSILESAVAGLNARYAFILLEQPDGTKLALAAANGLTASEFRRVDANANSNIFARIFAGQDVIILETERLHAELNFLPNSETTTLIAAPVRAATSAFGILCLGLAADAAAVSSLVAPVSLIAAMTAQSLRLRNAALGEREKLRDENLHLKQELKEKYDFSHLIGKSSAIRHVYDQVTQVARSNATVLLRGESGTGKEMIANAIHYNSLRSKRPFIKINCAALPETLIESELFGHEKGAFTGADRFRKGRFEMADGGTLFLDEIGDIPPQTQIKLLRVLQEREFERLGGGETIKTNIRLITATNKNLETAIARGQFREDLYYRLNVFTIFLPPLRERKSDILLLAEHFLEKYEAEHGKRVRRISTPAIDMLMSYHFPGNVRELENAIERAVVACEANVIHSHHLPPTLQTAENSGTVTDLSLAAAVAAFERGVIQDALKSTGGNVSKAARQLDSTERILGYKIKKYGIDPQRFRR